MERDLKDKVIVITGAAQGLGLNIAEKFLQNDVKIVIILDINQKIGTAATRKLNSTYGEDRSVFILCDVTKDLEKVSKEIFEKFQYVDVLVNNAGIIDESSIRKCLEVNTIAVVDWSVMFREHMRADKSGKGGTIINIASVYGYMIDPFLLYYKTSKHAVLGFTKCLGHEFNYKKTKVRAIALCPGFTFTDLITCKMAWAEHNEDFEEFKKHQEWQEPDVVGNAVIEIFVKAESGTAWAVIGSRPIEQVL